MVELREGPSVELRPMMPTDADGLVRFHHTLSGDTTYLRYFAFHPELSPAELLRFTNVDHRDREAVVAVAAGEIVGVGRYDCIAGGDVAEIAFVVTDAWRGRGLGPALFQWLVERARAAGLRRFTAQTLSRNSRMLAVFEHCGLPCTTHLDDGVVDVVIELLES